MVKDAAFEDGGERALRLSAESAEDVGVIASLVQDAVCKVAKINYSRRRRRFSVLLYRFRWEDVENAEREKRPYERVASSLILDDVLNVRAAGVDPAEGETVLNLLTMSFEAGADGAGVVTLNCSDNAVFRLDVECVNMRLVDLTRPWAAGGKPQHFD